MSSLYVPAGDLKPDSVTANSGTKDFLDHTGTTLKIGILGTRGIPNAYGGFEQFAQHLSVGLVEKGHEVWVYNSHNHPYQLPELNGVHIIHCRDWEYRIGTAGQFFYDYNCIMDARKRNFDILLQLGYTSNSVWHSLWPKKAVNIINMDGLEWKRSKYNKFTRLFLKYAERLAANNADLLIADAVSIKEYLEIKYKKELTYIPYGAYPFEATDDTVLKDYDFTAKQYFLLVARIEPECNIEMIIKGYLASEKKYPLIIVGNAGNKFGKYLQAKYKNEQIKFLGSVYEPLHLNTIRYYSSLYFHGHSVGGTNPSLLEAMSCKCNIAAHNNVFNKSVLGDGGYYFGDVDMVKQIINTHCNHSPVLEQRQQMNLQKIKNHYTWPAIINSYEKLFLEVFASRYQ